MLNLYFNASILPFDRDGLLFLLHVQTQRCAAILLRIIVYSRTASIYQLIRPLNEVHNNWEMLFPTIFKIKV